MHASAISGAADEAVRDARPWIERLARLGFVAKGLLYMTIGALATTAALGLGSMGHESALGQRGAMGALLDAPFGRALLVAIAIGLFGYAAWRFVEAVRDPLHHAKDAKGIAKRVRSAVLGAIQLGLGISALKIALGHVEAATDGRTSAQYTARAMHTTGGTLVLWAVAAGLVGFGLFELYAAWQTKLDKELMLGQLSAGARRIVIGASRFGIAARGVVFATTGLIVAHAIQHRNPQEVRGMKTGLVAVFSFAGRWPFAIIAVGLVAYGVYQMLNARYRRIDVA
jgi:hypothetical protein